jgi:hypothetical protein
LFGGNAYARFFFEEDFFLEDFFAAFFFFAMVFRAEHELFVRSVREEFLCLI